MEHQEEENRELTFLEKHTHTTADGKKQINVVTALNELDARDKTRYVQVDEIQKAIAGIAGYLDLIDKRIKALEPTIDIVSPEQAKIILKG